MPQTEPSPTVRDPDATGRSTPARAVVGAPAFMAASCPYLVAQVVVAAAWTDPPYDWDADDISDLGSTACGPSTAGGRATEVCSPLHEVMNGSSVTSGVLTVLGAAALPRRRAERSS